MVELPKNLKVALVHDQLNQAGGAERVLFVLSRLFPTAPIYTLIYDKKKLGGFDDRTVRTSFIQKIPGSLKRFKWFLPLMPTAVEALDLSQFDVVISSSSALIKGVITNPHTKHISYCHTPTRYLWSDTNNYVEDLNVPSFVKNIIPLFLSKLRLWDQISAQRVDHYIANSNFVAKRIKNYYHRDASVVFPPVDTENFKIADKVGDYFLMVGRLRPYKKFDLAIKAFNKTGHKLKIAGTGEDMERLKKMAKPNIEFLGGVDEATKRKLMSECLAFINPQVEDFGITAVEAIASGRPVIAYADGGAMEIIQEGVNGTFMAEQTWESLAHILCFFDPSAYNPQTIKASAERFHYSKFNQEILDIIAKELNLPA